MKELIMRFPGGKKKAFTMSYDDGVEQDIRLISIMKKYSLKGTFNLNSGLWAEEGTVYPPGEIHRRMSEKQAYEVYRDSGMEIAVHGLNHEFLDQLPANLCAGEIMKDRENLERRFGRLVRGMAYAYGAYSDKAIQCLQCAGIVYARTVVSTGDFRLPTDWYRLTATCRHRDPCLMELARRFVEEESEQRSWLFYLWGHSFEFEADDNWELIEAFAKYMGGRDSVWYAANMELYDYMKAYENLIFSMDGTMVYNPGHLEVFFEKDGQIWKVGPGEMMTVPVVESKC